MRDLGRKLGFNFISFFLPSGLPRHPICKLKCNPQNGNKKLLPGPLSNDKTYR